jgi:hypothetical protein
MAALSLQLEPGAAVRRLVELANERGANDNVTVQLLAFGPPGETAVALDEDETERDLAALQVALAARDDPAESTMVVEAASLEEIWARAREVARARRRRRLRLVTVATTLVAILLLGALVWLRFGIDRGSAGGRAAVEAGAEESAPPDVSAPAGSGEAAP